MSEERNPRVVRARVSDRGLSEAQKINEGLHSIVGLAACETACTHRVTNEWTMLGIANVLGAHMSAVGGEETTPPRADEHIGWVDSTDPDDDRSFWWASSNESYDAMLDQDYIPVYAKPIAQGDTATYEPAGWLVKFTTVGGNEKAPTYHVAEPTELPPPYSDMWGTWNPVITPLFRRIPPENQT